MKTFISRGYDKDTIKHQIRKVDSISREETLKTNTKKEATERIPFVTTYNRTQPPIGKLLHKHWNILKINSKVAKSLNEPPMMAYKRNKNLRDILGSNRTADNKVIKHNNNYLKNGRCQPGIQSKVSYVASKS